MHDSYLQPSLAILFSSINTILGACHYVRKIWRWNRKNRVSAHGRDCWGVEKCPCPWSVGILWCAWTCRTTQSVMLQLRLSNSECNTYWLVLAGPTLEFSGTISLAALFACRFCPRGPAGAGPLYCNCKSVCRELLRPRITPICQSEGSLLAAGCALPSTWSATVSHCAKVISGIPTGMARSFCNSSS